MCIKQVFIIYILSHIYLHVLCVRVCVLYRTVYPGKQQQVYFIHTIKYDPSQMSVTAFCQRDCEDEIIHILSCIYLHVCV